MDIEFEITLTRADNNQTLFSQVAARPYADYALNEVYREIISSIQGEDYQADYNISIRKVG